MLKNEITNQQFLNKIKTDLGNDYIIGLHNVIYSHHLIFKNNQFYKKYFIREFNFDIEKETTREEKAINILNNGLYISGECMQNTISFLGINGNIKETDFNYWYDRFGKWNFKEKKQTEDFAVTVVIAIPNYIRVKKHDYFIGSTMYDERYNEQIQDILTQFLFKDKLPKEFVYGYYKKEYNEKVINYLNNSLMFFENPHHFIFLSEQNQEKVFLENLKRNEIPFSLIENINNEKLDKFNILEIDQKAFNNTIEEKMFKEKSKNKVLYKSK